MSKCLTLLGNINKVVGRKDKVQKSPGENQLYKQQMNACRPQNHQLPTNFERAELGIDIHHKPHKIL